MKPTKKSDAIEQFITSTFKIDRRSSIQSNTCAWCKGVAEEFRDELSVQEFRISGLCQKCQDETFGGGD